MKDWLSGNKSKKKKKQKKNRAFRKFLGPLKMIPIFVGFFVSISVCVLSSSAAFGSLRQPSAAVGSFQQQHGG